MASWIAWSRWFEVSSDDKTIGALEHSLMVHIAGWTDNVGTGWGADDGVVAQIARRLNTTPDKINAAFKQLQRRGYISLTEDRRNGRVLFRVDRRKDAA
jgi:DNA-binding MarR family transcriptional regulator